MNNVILDCDTGEDDAIAILVALANNIPISHIVTSFGNTTIANSTRNTSRLLSYVGATGINVVVGSSKPLMTHEYNAHVTAGVFVGKNGLCNTKLPASKIANVITPGEEKFAPLLCSLIQEQAPVDYIITGPCTNFAKICTTFGAKVSEYIERVFIMGGALYSAGNSGPTDPATGYASAEFNAYCDPHAFNIVLGSGLPLYVVSWDVTSTVTIPYDRVNRFTSQTRQGIFAKTLMHNFLTFYGLNHGRNFELNDPLTVLAYVGFGHWKEEKISVVTHGIRYGKTVLYPQGYPIYYFYLKIGEKDKVIGKILSDLDLSIAHSSKRSKPLLSLRYI